MRLAQKPCSSAVTASSVVFMLLVVLALLLLLLAAASASELAAAYAANAARSRDAAQRMRSLHDGKEEGEAGQLGNMDSGISRAQATSSLE